MKEKYKKLYDIMELLEDEFIEEAMEDTIKDKKEKIIWGSLWKYIVPAACTSILIIGSGFLLSKHNYIFKDNKDINTSNYNESNNKIQNNKNNENNKEEKEEIPQIKYEKNIADKDSLEKIICGALPEGAGGGNYGWLTVKSFEDLTSKNPARNNTESITELPVFKNEEGLWSERKGEEDFKEDEIYFGHIAYEETKNYSFDGTFTDRWGVCFCQDRQESLTDQLLGYTFYRLEFSIFESKEDGVIWGYKIMKPPSGTGKMYPLISLEEAQKKLRNGEFFTCNPYDKEVAKTAEILSVELEYLTQEYQVYLQPFYKFTITDKSWDKNLHKIMKSQGCKNWEDYTSASQVYVPAIQDKYLDIKEDAMLRTN